MEITFIASQARKLTNYCKTLQNINKEIQTAAEMGKSKIFTNIPIGQYAITKKCIIEAGYFITKRGDVTVNNTPSILIELEW